MNKKMTLMLALLLALALAMAGFAGCTPKTVNESVSDADAQQAAEAPEAPAETATETTNEVVYKVAITQIVDHPSLNVCKQGAIDKLAELGYVDGENITVMFENAQGDPAVATTIAQQFVSGKADVIMAIATPSAQAAYAAAMGNIPVVFSAVSEPAAAGLASEDGTNLAGVTGTSDKLPVAATFDLIKALTPDAVKVGILHNTSEVNSDVQLAKAQALAPEYGLEIVNVGITSTNEIASALDALLPQVDVVMNLTDNMVVSALPLVVQKCNEAGIALYGSEDTQVKGGALASAGVDYYELGKINGEMIAAILDGTPAEALPIATLKVPMLIVNTDQLALLGITVPDALLDKVELVTAEAAE